MNGVLRDDGKMGTGHPQQRKQLMGRHVASWIILGATTSLVQCLGSTRGVVPQDPDASPCGGGGIVSDEDKRRL